MGERKAPPFLEHERSGAWKTRIPLKRQVRPLKGVIVYCSKERGYMGFECDEHGYQVPMKDGYAVGDVVKFKITDGKIELCK